MTGKGKGEGRRVQYGYKARYWKWGAAERLGEKVNSFVRKTRGHSDYGGSS